MALSRAEVRELLIALLPPGARDLYDLDNTDSNVYKLYDGAAEAFKDHGSDVLDTARTELLNFQSLDAKITDWEAALGIATSRTALSGSDSQRREQIIGRLRESGGVSIPDIQAVMQPLLHYASASLIRVIETNRTGLRAAHTYTSAASAVIPDTSYVEKTFTVSDDGVVSAGGVTVGVTITHGTLENLSIRITGPDTTAKTWSAGTWTAGTGSVTAQAYRVSSPALNGADIYGTWTLRVTNAGAGTGTLTDATLFVEGAERDSASNNGLGAAIWHWGVFVDPTRVGWSGGIAGADLPAIRHTIKRVAHAHHFGNICRGSATVSPGNPYAVPDDYSCIPDQVIPTDSAWPYTSTTTTTAAGTASTSATLIAQHAARRRAAHTAAEGCVAYVRVP